MSAALALPAAGIAAAAPSYDACNGFVESLPATITTQGTWCMNRDLSTSLASGAAVTVQANNVTIDCNGFKLGGLPAGDTTLATGIASADRLNTTVRDCKVRGFFVGASLAGANSAGHVVEDSLFESNRSQGIVIEGPGSVARRNRVLETGPAPTSSASYGIRSLAGADVIDNDIRGVHSQHPQGYDAAGGVRVESGTAGNTGAQVAGNRIRDLSTSIGGYASGIVTSGYADIRGNYLRGPGTTGSEAIGCGSSASVAVDNHIGGFATALVQCYGVGNIVR